MPAWSDFSASVSGGGHIGVKIVTVSPDNNAIAKPAVIMMLPVAVPPLWQEPQPLEIPV